MTGKTEVEQTQLESPQVRSQPVSSGGASGSTSTAIFAVIFSLAALLASGFTWYQTQVINVKSESDLAIGVTEIGGQVSRLGDRISQLQVQQKNVIQREQLDARINQLTDGFDKQIDVLGQQQSVVNESIEKITQDLSKGVSAYQLDQVSQLMKLANNRAIFSADRDAAIKALKLADEQLKGMSNPRFSEVRRKINEEILSLEGVSVVDIEETSAQLRQLSKTISKLPLANEPPSSVLNIAVEESDASGWRAELATIWQEIKNSIQIQKVDRPPKPLLAPQQRYFLNQNLVLQLETAEIALLRGEAGVYQSNLGDAIEWLNDYFDLENEQVVVTIGKLETLKQQQINTQLPSIAGSYQALQSILGGS